MGGVGAHGLGLRDGLADILDAGKNGRQGDEFGIEGVGHQARQRRFADARRPPENQRMRLARLKSQAQRLAGAEQMLLTDDLIERFRAQQFGQRRRGGGSGIAKQIMVCRAHDACAPKG